MLNDWETEKIIHKIDIKNFEFLLNHNLIAEIEDDYFYLAEPIQSVREKLYKYLIEKTKVNLNIQDIENEIKLFIKKLNRYNEIKDICDALMGKIAELRGISIKQLHNEFGIFDSAE